jgi:hypothetical protein
MTVKEGSFAALTTLSTSSSTFPRTPCEKRHTLGMLLAAGIHERGSRASISASCAGHNVGC